MPIHTKAERKKKKIKRGAKGRITKVKRSKKK
jgi:hypothetical protein